MDVYTNPNLNPNTFRANLSNDEKIQEAKQLIAKANALLDEVKTSPDEEKDVIAKYKEDYCRGRKYYLNENSEIRSFGADGTRSFEEAERFPEFPYQYYLTEELAKRAKELKDFNDKLLAFKYCYDPDYEPDWEDTFEDKYYVYYFSDNYDYKVGNRTTWGANTVYFSSEEIAQKCADWLNSMKDKEE